MENTQIEQKNTLKMSSLLVSILITILFLVAIGYAVLKPKVFEKGGLDYALVIYPFDNYRVEKLIVVDPVENVDLFELHDGDIINVKNLPNYQMTIRAEVSPSTVSVRFDYNGVDKWRVDNIAPFSASYELYGNFDLLPVQLGENTVLTTPYGSRNAKGDAGKTRATTFTIINSDSELSPSGDVIKTDNGLEAQTSITTAPF